MAKALKTNKTLGELDLQDNKGLNTKGTEAFANMLETSKTITTLHLSAPKAAAPFTSRISELLERNNKRLEYRKAWEKPFAEDTAIRFFNHVAKSSSEIITTFPDEMALHIEQFLSLVDSYQLALTCKAAVTDVNHQALPIHQPIDEEREKKPHKRKIEETKPEKELTTKQTEGSWGLWVKKRRKLSEVATENSDNLIQGHPPFV